MKKSVLSLLFFFTMIFFLIFGFNNCSSNEDVVSYQSSSFSDECTHYVNEKIGADGFNSLDQISFLVTPPNGDWTDPSRDPNRSDQGYLDVLSVDEAHQVVYSGIPPSQEPVIVAVIDTGVDYNHPDLVNQMFANPNGLHGYDFYNNDGDAMDDQGHGTHVAGLIAAEGHNGEGIRGGSPEFVKIMPVKILSERGTLPSSRFGDFAQSIHFAVDQGADVINMSLGMTVNMVNNSSADRLFSGLKEALQYAVDRGVVVVIAAGNDNVELNNVKMTYPAKFGSEMDGVITVGAYDATDRTISPFSNFSPVYVEVQAPGSMDGGRGLLSTWPGRTYKRAPGTSMATPLVAGLVALTKVYLKRRGVNLTPSQIENLIKQSSLKYESLAALAQEGRVINYKTMVDRLVEIYESGIIEHPKNLKLRLGKTGRLAVKMNNFSSKLQFQWYHNGSSIPGANGIEFQIRNIGFQDQGEYYVEVRLESGDLVTSLKGRVEVVEGESCD